MLDTKVIQSVFNAAEKRSVQFTEIFVERSMALRTKFLSSKVHEIVHSVDFGIGIRLVNETEVVYGFTNSDKQEDLVKLTLNLADLLENNNDVEGPYQVKTKPNSPTVLNKSELPLDQVFEFFNMADKAARSSQKNIIQVAHTLNHRTREIAVYNSEGVSIHHKQPYTRLFVEAIAAKNGLQEMGYLGPGMILDISLLSRLNPTQIGEEVAKIAATKLEAELCPGGVMPVVIGNGFGGVIFHEACGHSLETSSVQIKASVFHDQMGNKIAHEAVTAYDDATVNECWGTIPFDDEGHPTQKTCLIKGGILKSFLVDRMGHLKTGHSRTGSGRRQSYRFAPASRMSNTYIAPGKYSLEEMVSSIDHGIYCKYLGGGSVMPGTGEFNFSALESYLIKNGKITTPLKGATLIGSGQEVLKNISMVGNDLELTAGTCGSVSGSIPVTVGQPSLKVDSILVGGK